jgi:predicted dienelactone hydrolase
MYLNYLPKICASGQPRKRLPLNQRLIMPVYPILRQRGSFQVKKEVWNLTDSSRNRSLYVDVYIPQTFRDGKTPVIIFSHGLASRPGRLCPSN